MSLTDGQILLRVYLRTADRSPHVPTWELLVRAARKGGLAGATVLQGIVGLGSRGFARQSNWTLVQQVPVIVEIVDDAASIGAFVRGPMNELMRTGMATLERAHVLLRRAHGPREPVVLRPAPPLAPISNFLDIEPGGPMKTKENGVMLRVFVGESDRFDSEPLYEAILKKVRELRGSGATVLRGTEGFGANSVVHKSTLLEMSTDLPVVIEIVDTREKIDQLLPYLEAMVSEGMITMEHVVVLLYRDGTGVK